MIDQRSQEPETKTTNPLPEYWIWVRLGQFCKTTTGGTPSRKHPKYFNGNIPWLKSGELENNFIIESSEESITQEAMENSSARIIPKGTLLVALYGATVGKLGILNIDAAINQAICAIFAPEGIEKKYLFWYLYQYRNHLLHIRKGGAQPNISQGIVNEIPIPVAPSAEQKRIVMKIEELFTKLDAGIEGLKKAKTQLRQYRLSVLRYAFEGKFTEQWRKKNLTKISEIVRYGIEDDSFRRSAKAKSQRFTLSQLPVGWRWTQVKSISSKIHYGFTASAIKNAVGQPKLLRITDIQNETVDWNTVPYCKIDDDEVVKYLLKPGDIVFARTGATVGKSYLATSNIPAAVFASYLIRIILDESVNNRFVSYFFQTPFYWTQINAGKIGIGQPNVNAQVLSQIFVPLPSYDEQVKIADEIERITSVIEKLQSVVDSNIIYAEKLRQIILKHVFEGRLSRKDPNDEPVTILIERMKKYRSELG